MGQASSINMPVKSPDKRGGACGNKEFADYLSSINLSALATHDFELKTLPRPKGADTKVIITEYDLPRPNAEPHDVSPGKAGMIWYQDFADGILGRLIPATGEIKEWTDSLTKARISLRISMPRMDRAGKYLDRQARLERPRPVQPKQNSSPTTISTRRCEGRSHQRRRQRDGMGQRHGEQFRCKVRSRDQTSDAFRGIST